MRGFLLNINVSESYPETPTYNTYVESERKNHASTSCGPRRGESLDLSVYAPEGAGLRCVPLETLYGPCMPLNIRATSS